MQMKKVKSTQINDDIVPGYVFKPWPRRMQAAYDRMQPACDRMMAAYYDCMQGVNAGKHSFR